MRRHLLVLVLLVVSTTSSAGPLADALRQIGVTRTPECLKSMPALLAASVSTDARTIDEWQCVLVGNLNRSQTVRLLGKPSNASTGFLRYYDRVRDPDTDARYVLQVFYGNGEARPATSVQYFTFDPSHNPFRAP